MLFFSCDRLLWFFSSCWTLSLKATGEKCSHFYLHYIHMFPWLHSKIYEFKKKKAEALHTTKALKAQCTFFLVHRVYIILLTGQCDPNVIPNRHIRAFLKWFRGKTRLWLTKYNLENMLKLNVGLHCNV